MGFKQDYWDKNYADPDEMDGIVNASTHAIYLKAFFDLELHEIKSLVDLGFGLGYLFSAMIKKFDPYRVMGIEPSVYAREEFQRRAKLEIKNYKIKIIEDNLYDWCTKIEKSKVSFDLGLCTSVFQYIPDQELKEIIPILSQKIKYLYFTVPTDKELKRQIEELGFKDEYAIHRTKEFYIKLLSKHFTFVGSRILESKNFYHEDNTPMTDLLFRF